MAELTPQQRMFVAEYLIDNNGKQAAIRAGYSAKTAENQASRLLSSVKVQKMLDKHICEQEKRTFITADRVLNELANIAFANGTEFAKVVEKTGYKPLYDSDGKKIGEDAYIYQAVELVNTNELDNDKRSAISCIKETKFGIAVESCDKVKALELLGKHLKLFTDKTELTGENGKSFEIVIRRNNEDND